MKPGLQIYQNITYSKSTSYTVKTAISVYKVLICFLLVYLLVFKQKLNKPTFKDTHREKQPSNKTPALPVVV